MTLDLTNKINYSTIQDFVFDWVQLITGFPDSNIIHSNQNVPEPVGTFVKINCFLASEKLGSFDEQRFQKSGTGSEQTGLIEIIEHRNLTISINVLSTISQVDVNAIQISNDLNNSFDFPSVKELFSVNDIGYIRSTNVQDLTFIESENYIQRGQFDFIINVAGSIIDDVGYFDKVILNNKYIADGNC